MFKGVLYVFKFWPSQLVHSPLCRLSVWFILKDNHRLIINHYQSCSFHCQSSNSYEHKLHVRRNICHILQQLSLRNMTKSWWNDCHTISLDILSILTLWQLQSHHTHTLAVTIQNSKFSIEVPALQIHLPRLALTRRSGVISYYHTSKQLKPPAKQVQNKRASKHFSLVSKRFS